MLTVAARAYLILQVFDYVHRSPEPVRFFRLRKDLEDLAAWPEFREAAIKDPRFLVVGDCIDIATAGIHVSCAVEEIVLQTVDLLRVPMTDQTLARLVRRLRPDLPDEVDPIARALATGRVFRPRNGHIALLTWLKDARPLPRPDVFLPGFEAAAAEILEQAGEPLGAANLAATLAEQFDLSIKEAYTSLAESPSLLLLPDGTISLYDPVADEVWHILNQEDRGYNYEQTKTAVPLPGQDQPVELPPGLIQQITRRCLATGSPVSTAEIVREILGLGPVDPLYIPTFREVSAALGYSAEMVPVGHNLWQALAMVPAEVFRRVQAKADPDAEAGGQAAGQSELTKLIPDEVKKTDYVYITVTAAQLEAGCLNDFRLGLMLPDYPMVQVLKWHGQDATAWYNAEYFTIYGLTPWLAAQNVQPGDRVLVRALPDCLQGSVQKAAIHSPASATPGKVGRPGIKRRSLLAAVKDILISAGGTLDQDELIALLNEEDQEITWSEVEPLFERFSFLRYGQGHCHLVSQGEHLKPADPGNRLVEARVLSILSNVPDIVRSDPRVLDLARLVAAQPRVVTAHEEALLMVAARQGGRAEWEHLIKSHLRFVLRMLLHRNDIEELLPGIEDYFQEGVKGLIKTINSFDLSRHARLQVVMGWRVKTAIDRAKLRHISPIRFPDHFGEQLNRYKKKLARLPVPEEEMIPAEEFSQLVEFWSDAAFIEWDPVMEEYEETGKPLWLGAEQAESTFDEEFVEQELIKDLMAFLKPRDADIVARRFGLFGLPKETHDEIGQRYGFTRSRAQQIEKKALVSLRRKFLKLTRQLIS